MALTDTKTRTAVAMQQQGAFNDRVLSALHCCDQNIRAIKLMVPLNSQNS